MRKLLIALLGIAFLLPASAYAGSYCVSFPWNGNSKWSKRDNNIGVRFRISYFKHGHQLKFTPEDNIFASGVVSGEDGPRQSGSGYTYYDYRTPDLCLDQDSIHVPRAAGRRAEVRLDVRWGGDCEKAEILSGSLTGDHRFQIRRRKGDHINPWKCGRK